MNQMERSVLNYCWEFCHEVLVADPKDDNCIVLILNLPRSFSDILETRLLKAGFKCTSFRLHGSQSVIAKFKKARCAIKN